jgi:hypothetical protein
MKYLTIAILCFLCIGATFRAGWSYSSQITFKIKEPSQVTLYHDPESPHPYEGAPDEAPIFDKKLGPGKYMLTIEGYYHLDVK